MIFDRIDIFVVCIVVCLCLCIAEGFIGDRDAFADFVIVTFLISEFCYTSRCNEKLQIELIEAKEKLKEKTTETNRKLKYAECELESAHLEIAKKRKVVSVYILLKKLWQERWECEHAKVNYCKRKITSRQLVDAMNHAEKEESEISDKIVEIDKELNELYLKK